MREEPATLVVELRARPDAVEDVLEATRNVIPMVMREPNFARIDFYRDPDDPAHILLVEQWSSRSYLLSEAHQRSPHLSSYFAAIAPHLAEPAKWTVWRSEATYQERDVD